MVGLPTASLELAAFGASKLGLVSELEACLKKEPGALNRRDDKGRACLHHAANYGFENCLDALLVYPGIELDAQDSAGDTALHLAAVNGFPMCAFNLTKAAPQTCLIANNVKETAIDVAVANDRGEVLNAMLLACAGIRSEEALKSISALLDAGAVPDTWAPNGSSALMLAAAVDSVDALQVLLKNGATVELQDALGRTALMFAAGSSAEAALGALLDSGASLAARDRRGKGILDYAPPDSTVRTILEDRLKVLEAAAEQLQAALLASIDEESSTKQQVKGKRKGGKKGKRSKKNGPSPPAEPSIQAAADEEQEQEEGTSIDPPKDQGPAQAGPSGQLDSAQSDAESDATVFDDRGQPAAAPAPAVSSTGGAPEQQRSQSEARGGTSEDEAEWKVVGKSTRKPSSRGTPPSKAVVPAQPPPPPSQQQLTGTATPPQQRPAQYKRCPSVTSLSDSSCSAESEHSMASAACHGHRAQNARPNQQHQQQHGPSPQPVTLGQCLPTRPAGAAAAKAATPPKPAAPRSAAVTAQHDGSSSGAPAHATANWGSAASTSSSKPAETKQTGVPGSQAAWEGPAGQHQQQRTGQHETWAGKVAGTPPKIDPGAANNKQNAGSLCATSHQEDPPCARPQACQGPAVRSASLPAPEARQLTLDQALVDELEAARADVAASRREAALLAAEVERLRAAVACSEAARQQEVAQLLQNAAHHESLAIEEAVRQEKEAMTARLLSTFESLKGLQVNPGQPAKHGFATLASDSATPSPKGLMGTLLDVQPGVVIGSRAPPAVFPPAAAFSAFEASAGNDAGAANLGTARLGAELSLLLSGMGGGAASYQLPPKLDAAADGGYAPASLRRKATAAQPISEPFSFFNGASIWK